MRVRVCVVRMRALMYRELDEDTEYIKNLN